MQIDLFTQNVANVKLVNERGDQTEHALFLRKREYTDVFGMAERERESAFYFNLNVQAPNACIPCFNTSQHNWPIFVGQNLGPINRALVYHII